MQQSHQSELLKELEDMTMSHKKNVMQIAAFQTITDAVYGINIAKIKEFAMIKDAQITKGLSENPLVMGVAVLRNHPVPLVNLIKWLGVRGEDTDNLDNYNILVMCEFNQSLIAFPVNKILTIASKSSEELERSETTDSKVTYVTRIQINKARSRRRRNRHKKQFRQYQSEVSDVKIAEEEENSELICFVLDVEKMLDEIFPEIKTKKLAELQTLHVHSIHSNQLLAIIEDSPVARKVLEKTFEQAGINTLYFGNGLEFKAWYVKNAEQAAKNLGCVITDIEMPMMDGYKVVEFIREKNPTLPIIVNTSMSNVGVIKKLEDMGVNEFIPKTEPAKIYQAVQTFMEQKNG